MFKFLKLFLNQKVKIPKEFKNWEELAKKIKRNAKKLDKKVKKGVVNKSVFRY